jgi:hypothetical protein
MSPATAAVNSAINKLGRVRPDSRFFINAVANAANKDEKPTLWVAGELLSAPGPPDDFAQGANADIEAATTGGGSVTARVALKPGERTFLTTLALPAGASGELNVKARLAPAEGSTVPLSDAVRVTLPAGAQSLLFRRGVTTGNRIVPAADYRFSRTERLRVEVPLNGDVKAGAGRVLDRNGQPLQPPVTISERKDEATGQRWVTADVTLAPLGAGDYVIEVQLTGGTEERVLTPIRVVR